MLIAALKLSVLYWLLGILDTAALGWQALTRPIVICPLVGILLGDVTTGCILGASLESLFMGISAIGRLDSGRCHNDQLCCNSLCYSDRG